MNDDEQKAEDEEKWVDIGTYATKDEAFDHALVALAMGEAVRVEYEDCAGDYALQAEEGAVLKIVRELQKYRDEQAEVAERKSAPSNWHQFPAGVPILMAWVGILLTVFRLQMRNGSLVDGYASSSAGFVGRGEWWRPFTALFLHGDGLHLAGNLGAGAIFGMMVSKCVGSLRGWFLILLSGALGNATTSLVMYPEEFVSLGASSAVFGALGVLSGVGFVESIREDVRMPRFGFFAPVIAGLVLLGLWGGAEVGASTDVFGHVFGFMIGIVAGVVCRYVMRHEIEALRPMEKESMDGTK